MRIDILHNNQFGSIECGRYVNIRSHGLTATTTSCVIVLLSLIALVYQERVNTRSRCDAASFDAREKISCSIRVRIRVRHVIVVLLNIECELSVIVLNKIINK